MATERPLERSEFPDERFQAVERTQYLDERPPPSRAPLAVPLGVAALALAAAVVRLWLAGKIVTPWIMVDELIYSELAKSFAESGEFLVREQPAGLYAVLYPLLLSPAWLADSMTTTYSLAKAVNVAAMTLAVVPVYLWARKLVSFPFALVAVALTLVMPSFAYTGTLMTENAFFPAFLAAAFAIALTLERPTLARQALALGAVALTASARLQGLVLLLVFATAVALKLLFDLRAERPARRARFLAGEFRRYLPSVGAVAVLAAGYVIVKVVEGTPVTSGLGAYGGVTAVDYDISSAGRWILLHAAELTLSVAVVPLSALIVLVGLALTSSAGMTTAERAFVALAASSVFWLVVQVGVFASRFTLRINERYLFGLAPLLFLALAVWLSRRSPRPPLLTAFAAVAPAALLVALPLGDVINASVLSDAFALIPLLRLSQLVSGGLETVKVLLVLGGLAAAVAFAVLPRRLGAFALPAGVATFLVLSSYSVFGSVRDYSRSLDVATRGAATSWVDERLVDGAEAAYVYNAVGDASYESAVLWQTEFWNRGVGSVYRLGLPAFGPLHEDEARLDRATGRIVVRSGRRGREPRHAVAAPNLALAGDAVARSEGLRLYRLDPPFRLAELTEGVYADGWMAGEAAYSRYAASAPRPAAVDVTLSRRAWGGPDVPSRVRIEVGKPVATGQDVGLANVRARRTSTLRALRQKVFTMTTPAPPFRVEVHVTPTFSPARFGHADTRQLGAQVSFRFRPDGRGA